MLGFEEGENLFLTDTGRMDGYRPFNFERVPFFASAAGLAIDLDHPRARAGTGKRLFADDGAPTPYLQHIITVFQELRAGTDETREFIRSMLDYKLVEPVDISVSFDDGSRCAVNGAYTLNRDTIFELRDAEILDLFRRGYLHLASLMIASLNQIGALGRRRNDALSGVKR
jgi:hypothetical protein